MANDFTARVAGISVELGMSVQNKSGIWCKPKNYGRQGKPTAVSKKFSGNTLKDAEGKDIVFK